MIVSLTTICVGVLSGPVIYKICKWIGEVDVAALNKEITDRRILATTDHSILASVANRLEELYGGAAHVGLRIPDPETRSLQNIDIVLDRNNGKAIVISVKNYSEPVSIDNDGSWHCMGEAVRPNPVEEVKIQASILESYLEQRGIISGEGCLSYKVILLNPRVRPIPLNIPEVVTYEQLMQMKPEHPKLNVILSTAPKWDRLWLEGNKLVLGEFLEFKGGQEDIRVLRCIERSNVNRLIIRKPSYSTLIVRYCHRSFQEQGASASEWKQLTSTSEWKELTMGSSRVEVLLRPENSSKVQKFKLSSIVSLELSA